MHPTLHFTLYNDLAELFNRLVKYHFQTSKELTQLSGVSGNNDRPIDINHRAGAVLQWALLRLVCGNPDLKIDSIPHLGVMFYSMTPLSFYSNYLNHQINYNAMVCVAQIDTTGSEQSEPIRARLRPSS